MTASVFISYARSTSAAAARALKAELGEDAFLDETELEAGEQFPQPLFEALLESRVVVVFADEQYFRSWYCLRELETALHPFLRAPDAAAADAVLDHVLVVLPPRGTAVNIDHLPPALRLGHWPRADEREEQVRLVHKRLGPQSATLSERIRRSGAGGTSGCAAGCSTSTSRFGPAPAQWTKNAVSSRRSCP